MLGVALWENNLGVSIYDTFSWQRIRLIRGISRVRAIAFSPDSQHILSGDDVRRVMLWDCTSGERLLVMKGHTDGVTSLAFSHCGKQIASGSTDDTVRLWDSQTGVMLFVLKGHTLLVSSVKFSPHGHQLVSGSWDGTIRFWNTETGEAVVVWSPSLGGIYSLDISPDGQWIVSGHKEGDLRLWDAASGNPGLVLRRHSEFILGVAFSPNGQLIASSCMDRKVFLWDASTGDVVSTFGSRLGRISGVAFSPDGLTIAMGSYEKRVLLSEVNSSKSNIETQDQIDGASIVAYSSDGLSILSVNGRGIVRVWDAKTGVGGSVLFELPSLSLITTLGISWNSNQIATGCGDGSVRLWDSSTGATGPMLKGHWMTVKNLACSACGRWIASSDFGRDVRLWDLHDLGQKYILVDIRRNSDCDGIAGLTFSPTGHELAVGSGNGKVWVFDPRTRGLLMCKRLKKRLSGVMEYSPNGQQLALVTEDSIVFWDLHSDERCSEMKVLVNSRTIYRVFQHIAYSPCGQFLVSSNSRRIIHLWHRRLGTENLESWSCVFALRVFHTDVRSLSWNPIVPMEFVTASRDGSVRVWRVSSDDGGVAVKMLWGSNIRILCTTSVVLEGATGLSPTHQKLLDQREAFDRVHSLNPIFLRLLAKGGGSVDRGPSSEDKRSHPEVIEWSTVEFAEVSEEESQRV
jgi:WD40 repeat protein